MNGVLVLWLGVVAFAAILVFGTVAPSLFLRRRRRRASGPWIALAIFAAGVVLVAVLTVVLAERLSTVLASFWVWSFPVFFVLIAVFASWFFHNAGYRTDTKALGILLFLALGSGVFAYYVQPVPWDLGHVGIP
ncbi:MAG: hypothetical protein HKL79_06955 [Thermoplasmata archaeon]|nr:hypothetical protein [Thermoplasmata archaeon]